MYAKVFRSLWDGSLADRWEVWAVMVFLLAHADRDGVVEMTQQAISRRGCVPLEIVERSIATLCEPDPSSRTPDEEGRRLVPLDGRGWGWRIVNYDRYRHLTDDAERRRQNREAARSYRERKRKEAETADVKPSEVSQPSAAVSEHHQASPDISTGRGRGRGRSRRTNTGESVINVSSSVSTVDDADVVQPAARWEAAFERWWATYRKGGRAPALRRWMETQPRSLRTYRQIMQGTRTYLAANPDPQYRKDGEGYLHQRLWDGYEPPRPAASSRRVLETATPLPDMTPESSAANAAAAAALVSSLAGRMGGR